MEDCRRDRHIVHRQAEVDGKSAFLVILATRLESCNEFAKVRVGIRSLAEISNRFVILELGVIIGAAFGKIINSLVNDVIMPLLNPLMPGGDWRTIEVGPGVKIGSFLATTLDFLVIALVVFVIVKGINTLKRKEEAKPAGPADLPPDVKLLTEIRDVLKSERKG